MIVCNAMNFWTSPDIVQDWEIDGVSLDYFRVLFSNWCEETVYEGEYAVVEDEWVQRIENVGPREIFSGDDGEIKRMCQDGQALLDKGDTFTEQKYRELCDIFMRIYRAS